jgi:hypothetical protein
MCVRASSNYDLNGGLCLNVISTAVIVGDCHGRPDSETLKTLLMNHVKTLLGSTQNLEREGSESAPKLKKDPKFSLTHPLILMVLFQTGKKKEVAQVVNSR